ERGRSGGTDARPRLPALQRAALVLAHASPDAVVLSRLQRPLQALLAHIAAPADNLGLFDLPKSRTGVSDREEQLRVLLKTRSAVTPVHGDDSFLRHVVTSRRARDRACVCEYLHDLGRKTPATAHVDPVRHRPQYAPLSSSNDRRKK